MQNGKKREPKNDKVQAVFSKYMKMHSKRKVLESFLVEEEKDGREREKKINK